MQGLRERQACLLDVHLNADAIVSSAHSMQRYLQAAQQARASTTPTRYTRITCAYVIAACHIDLPPACCSSSSLRQRHRQAECYRWHVRQGPASRHRHILHSPGAGYL